MEAVSVRTSSGDGLIVRRSSEKTKVEPRSRSCPRRISWVETTPASKVKESYYDLHASCMCAKWLRCEYSNSFRDKIPEPWLMFRHGVDSFIEKSVSMRETSSFADEAHQEMEIAVMYLNLIDCMRQSPEEEVSVFDRNIAHHCIYHWQRAQAFALKLENKSGFERVIIGIADSLYRANHIRRSLEAIDQLGFESSQRQQWLRMKERDLYRSIIEPNEDLEALLALVKSKIKQEAKPSEKKDSARNKLLRSNTPTPKDMSLHVQEIQDKINAVKGAL